MYFTQSSFLDFSLTLAKLRLGRGNQERRKYSLLCISSAMNRNYNILAEQQNQKAINPNKKKTVGKYNGFHTTDKVSKKLQDIRHIKSYVTLMTISKIERKKGTNKKGGATLQMLFEGDKKKYLYIFLSLRSLHSYKRVGLR